MKILITGALGHIGSKLIKSIKPGQFKEVVLIDNLSTQRYASLFNLPKGIKFSFFNKDICNTDCSNYFKGIKVVIHLAAITDATSSFEKQKEVEQVNYFGTKKIAYACVKNNCRLIFPSTTSVYGVSRKLVDENCSRKDLKPQSPYAKSKLRAEDLLKRFGKEKKLRFIIVRLGTIFGPSVGMRFHTAVNKFVWQAVLGDPITVWKTALHQKRPYLDLNDAVKAFFFIIKKDLFSNEIYNIVTLNSTVLNIIKIIKKQIPGLKTSLVKTKIMNQLSYEVSSQKFVNTDFQFSGDLEKEINNTIKILYGIKQ